MADTKLISIMEYHEMKHGRSGTIPASTRGRRATASAAALGEVAVCGMRQAVK